MVLIKSGKHREITVTPSEAARSASRPETFRLPKSGGDPFFGITRSFYYRGEELGYWRLIRPRERGKLRGVTLVPFDQASGLRSQTDGGQMNTPSGQKRGRPFGGGLIPTWSQKTPTRLISTSKRADYYKPLETHFQRGKFNYKRIAREKDVAIFEQAWRGSSEPDICWEVVVIRRHSGKTIKGHWVEPSELYPSSSEWGKYGFSFTDKEAAFAKLREVSQRPRSRRRLKRRKLSFHFSQIPPRNGIAAARRRRFCNQRRAKLRRKTK